MPSCWLLLLGFALALASRPGPHADAETAPRCSRRRRSGDLAVDVKDGPACSATAARLTRLAFVDPCVADGDTTSSTFAVAMSRYPCCDTAETRSQDASNVAYSNGNRDASRGGISMMCLFDQAVSDDALEHGEVIVDHSTAARRARATRPSPPRRARVPRCSVPPLAALRTVLAAAAGGLCSNARRVRAYRRRKAGLPRPRTRTAARPREGCDPLDADRCRLGRNLAGVGG